VLDRQRDDANKDDALRRGGRRARAHRARDEEYARDKVVMEMMMRTRCSGETRDERRGACVGRRLAGETRRARTRGAGDEAHT
jgi:hypothetical protein